MEYINENEVKKALRESIEEKDDKKPEKFDVDALTDELLKDKAKFEKMFKIGQFKSLVEKACAKFSNITELEEFYCTFEKRRTGGYSIDVTSGNLAGKGNLGLFDKILETCILSDFGSFVTFNDDGTPTARITLNLAYERFSGGSNGMDFEDFEFDGKKWSVRK